MSIQDENKAWLARLRKAPRSEEAEQVKSSLFEVFHTNARIHMGAPFYDVPIREAAR